MRRHAARTLSATLLASFALLLTNSSAPAQEIGYVEDFALAEKREDALKTLIPGSQDFYYYHCLHYLNTQQYDQVRKLLADWIKRYRNTPQIVEVQHRLALLTYDNDHAETLQYLRTRLNLNFNHQRIVLGADPRLPTKLDPDKISRKVWIDLATRGRADLNLIEDSGLEKMLSRQLTNTQRRNLLQRIQRPDVDGLVEAIVTDLKTPGSGGFGSLSIHKRLLQSQLADLVQQIPTLKNDARFVNANLVRMQPTDVDGWRFDPVKKLAYLDSLWNYVKTLSTVHNSLKAHVLYHRLDFDRSQGVYDKQRFMDYIKLPRGVSYINRKYLERPENRRSTANLSQDYRTVTMMPPVGNDQPLVRSYLHQFFVEEASYDAYLPYLSDTFVKGEFAETKLVNGLGNAEQWFSLLPPGRFQTLRDRVDLDFALTNKTRFEDDEPVVLDLFVKNVENLIVKVYEINTQNYYRNRGRDVGVEIPLDGLVANHETPNTYNEAPIRRVKRQFRFPMIDRRGVYVVDFIGNGRNSRALIRKGRLRKLLRTTSAGHEFTVLNSKDEVVKKAKLWMAGRTYEADEDGLILVPFSTKPGRQSIVLSDGDFDWLDSFNHQAESYQLQAGLHVDRESLLAGRKSTIIIRPSLRINGNEAALALLEDVVLHIVTTKQDGTQNSREVKDLKFEHGKDSRVEIRTPVQLRQLTLRLTAKVKSISQNKKVDLAATRQFSLNGIDATDKVDDVHFAKVGDRYLLEVVGKTGEAKSKRPVAVRLKHQEFRPTMTFTLQSDGKGQIDLGPLDGIVSVVATPAGGQGKAFAPTRDRHSGRSMIYATSGEDILVPYTGNRDEASRDELSLLEIRGNAFSSDRFRALSIDGGMIRIRGLNEGQYNLRVKSANAEISILVMDAKVKEDFQISKHRIAERRGRNEIQIRSIESDDENVTIRLHNVTPSARVHLIATRYLPEYDAFGNLAVRDLNSGSWMQGPRLSHYSAGRAIGDEYRYIIDRQYAPKYPGNLLDQPGLLLNPWAVRKTDASKEELAPPESPDASPAPTDSEAKAGAVKSGAAAAATAFANLDFLASSSPLLLNATPDAKGRIVIKRESLGGRPFLTVIAVDASATAMRTAALAKWNADFVDLRLREGISPELHVVQRKRITAIHDEESLTISDYASSKFETYGGLGEVFALYMTLNPDPNLVKFAFLRQWNTLEANRQRELYSEFACHELNFFLYHKDRKFFDSVIRPYLANKLHKTFMDHWLLGSNLTAYERPWAYSQLNAVERILLVRRNDEARKRGIRRAADLYDLLPPTPDETDRLYLSALFGRELEGLDVKGNDRGGFAGRFAAPGGGGAGGFGAVGGRPARTRGSMGGEKDVRRLAELELADEMKQTRRDLSLNLARKSKASESMYKRASRRGRSHRLYIKLDKTQEWAENNYYKLPIAKQNANLVKINAFWRDYAAADPNKPFLSTSFPEATKSFTEMMLALAVLDLPLDGSEVKSEIEDTSAKLTTDGKAIVFHQEYEQVEADNAATPILVSQNFYRRDDPYRTVEGERRDKFVRDEFLIHTVYGCRVVVTNPTSTPQKLRLLLQTPVGSIPVLNGQRTKSVSISLAPYHAQTVDYFFYFPYAGEFQHFPVHVSKDAQLLAFAKPLEINVVEKPSKIDKTSWAYISQYGENDDVLEYLKNNNPLRTDLNKIAFRMQDKRFFRQTLDLLIELGVYNHTLWSYGVKHDDAAAIQEHLRHNANFVNQCGLALNSPLLSINPVERKTFEFLEYRPLVNPRAHQLGAKAKILNNRLRGQYQSLLKVLSYHRELSNEHRLQVVYYLLSQGRIDAAIKHFGTVDRDSVEAKLQYDYASLYLSFYLAKLDDAAELVARYDEYPVDRWREIFTRAANQLKEIRGGAVAVANEDSREETQEQLASMQPSFEFKVEAKEIAMTYENLKDVRVNYYEMDIELMFSRNPFVQQYSDQFSFIKPNHTQMVKLDKKGTKKITLPKQLHNKNVLVEVVGAGRSKAQAYYSNSLSTKLYEDFGQLRVTQDRRPLPRVYVKVYARMQDGRTQFYKDGYTDLRGRFDYASLNSDDLNQVSRFSLLLMSEENGAVVREAAPPKR